MDWKRTVPFAFVCAALALGGCRRESAVAAAADSPSGPVHLRLQLDWHPQIESGGYYQAQARGFYRAQGLEVEILSGGPGVPIKENVVEGRAELGCNDGNCVVAAVSSGLPLMIVGAEMQRNPQGLMFHRTHPLRNFRDLDGRTLIASSSMAWVEFVQRSQRVRFDLMPNTLDLAGFVADESLVRQCFITQEPIIAAQLGASVDTLLLADSGYDPYRVIYASRDYAARNPDVIRRFLAATIAGYNDLLEGDPAPALAAIAAANPRMSQDLMRKGLARMNELRLVQGRADEGERTGRIIRERIAAQIELLRQLGQLPRSVTVDEVARFDLLPVAGVAVRGTHRTP